MYLADFLELKNDVRISFRYHLKDKRFSIFLESHPEYDLETVFYDNALKEFVKEEKIEKVWEDFKKQVKAVRL